MPVMQLSLSNQEAHSSCITAHPSMRRLAAVKSFLCSLFHLLPSPSYEKAVLRTDGFCQGRARRARRSGPLTGSGRSLIHDFEGEGSHC
jgi:hypothetical protein